MNGKQGEEQISSLMINLLHCDMEYDTAVGLMYPWQKSVT